MTDGVIIVGASGFGRETADVLEAMGIPIRGILDDHPSDLNLTRVRDRGLDFLGTVDEWLARTDDPAEYLIGIGNTRVRERLARKFDLAGHTAFKAIHPTVTVGARTTIGPGTVLCAGARVSTNVNLGQHVHLNPNAVVGHDAVLADFVSVNPTANISGEVIVGSRTLIGAGATVLQGLTVGEDVVVGASSLATKHIPAGVTVTGIPGRWSA